MVIERVLGVKRNVIIKLVDYHEGISTSSIVERCAEQFNLRKGLKKKI